MCTLIIILLTLLAKVRIFFFQFMLYILSCACHIKASVDGGNAYVSLMKQMKLFLSKHTMFSCIDRRDGVNFCCCKNKGFHSVMLYMD